jgi:WD40 repeat protein
MCKCELQADVAVNSVCLQTNQCELFVADSVGTVYLWDLRSDKNDMVPLSLDMLEYVAHLTVDATGRQLAAVTNRGRAIVWNVDEQVHSIDLPLS